MTQNQNQESQRLSRHERLRGKRNFARVLAKRCSVGDTSLVIYVVGNELQHARIGTIVSRKVGNAVARARVRRLIREFFRKNKSGIPAGFDYACVAKRYGKPDNWELGSTSAKLALFGRAVRKLDRESSS